jgi:UDP:flavonoid glycosyltransferase YjiC (YdhE family)
MKAATVLFISYALRGHLNPCLPITPEIAARGHRVKTAIPEQALVQNRKP